MGKPGEVGSPQRMLRHDMNMLPARVFTPVVFLPVPGAAVSGDQVPATVVQ